MTNKFKTSIIVGLLYGILLASSLLLAGSAKDKQVKTYEYYVNLEPNHIEVTLPDGHIDTVKYGKLDQYFEETNQ